MAKKRPPSRRARAMIAKENRLEFYQEILPFLIKFPYQEARFYAEKLGIPANVVAARLRFLWADLLVRRDIRKYENCRSLFCFWRLPCHEPMRQLGKTEYADRREKNKEVKKRNRIEEKKRRIEKRIEEVAIRRELSEKRKKEAIERKYNRQVYLRLTRLVKENPHQTTKFYSEQIGYTGVRIAPMLRALKDRGVIDRVFVDNPTKHFKCVSEGFIAGESKKATAQQKEIRKNQESEEDKAYRKYWSLPKSERMRLDADRMDKQNSKEIPSYADYFIENGW
jgi:hypothetical protein